MTYELYDTNGRMVGSVQARSFREARTAFEPFHKEWIPDVRIKIEDKRNGDGSYREDGLFRVVRTELSFPHLIWLDLQFLDSSSVVETECGTEAVIPAQATQTTMAEKYLKRKPILAKMTGVENRSL
jgi:hypothetical protein